MSGALFLKALRSAYPGLVVQADGTPFVRPAFTGDATVYRTGFYWENADADRFYFDTAEDCAADAAENIGMDEREALELTS